MIRILLLFLFLSFAAAGQAPSDTMETRCLQLIGKKLNFYQTTTIDGLRIDSNYFKGKITILSFFGFGCGPCYTELGLLGEIGRTYPKDKYQILFIGDGAEKDLRDLRAYHSKGYGKLKRRQGVDTLAFDVVADCPDNPVRFIHRACPGSTVIFKVYALPTTFFVNRDGIITSVSTGFSMPRNKEADDYFYAKLKEAENEN